MRAVVRQVCGVCGLRLASKAKMDEHVGSHGHMEKKGGPGRWSPGQLSTSKDQMEFKPGLARTPWGQDLR